MELDLTLRRHWTAIHECGHAVVGHFLGLEMTSVNLMSETEGVTPFESASWPDSTTRLRVQSFWSRLTTVLAGELMVRRIVSDAAAEQVLEEEPDSPETDRRKAESFAETIVEMTGGSVEGALTIAEFEFHELADDFPDVLLAVRELAECLLDAQAGPNVEGDLPTNTLVGSSVRAFLLGFSDGSGPLEVFD